MEERIECLLGSKSTLCELEDAMKEANSMHDDYLSKNGRLIIQRLQQEVARLREENQRQKQDRDNWVAMWKSACDNTENRQTKSKQMMVFEERLRRESKKDRPA